ITEWWQQNPPAAPHTFTLLLTLSGQGGSQSTAEFVADVITEVIRTKPVRSHFTFTQGVHTIGQIGLLGGAQITAYRRVQLTQAA
ncbi:phage tail protein I, partial [Xylella fastidiosa]